MSRKDTTTATFTCDWKCGAEVSLENITPVPRQLNHAGVPQGWELLRKETSAVMTTSEHKGVPYMLCPRCYRLFEIAAMGDATPMGARFREFVNAFWANEQALNTLSETAGKHVQFNEVDVAGSQPKEEEFHG